MKVNSEVKCIEKRKKERNAFMVTVSKNYFSLADVALLFT